MAELWWYNKYTFQSIWNAYITLKIKIFLWLIKQNRILTREFIKKRMAMIQTAYFV
jgi:zinc-binding in reverse transcriptase